MKKALLQSLLPALLFVSIIQPVIAASKTDTLSLLLLCIEFAVGVLFVHIWLKLDSIESRLQDMEEAAEEEDEVSCD